MKTAIAVVLVLALAGGAVAFMLLRGHRADSNSHEASEPQIRSVLHLEPFVLNFAGSEPSAYLRVGIDLGLGHSLAKEEGASEPPTALIRDTILITLSSVKADDVNTPDGKQKLKQSIKKALEQRVPELGVREVYITEFLIQA